MAFIEVTAQWETRWMKLSPKIKYLINTNLIQHIKPYYNKEGYYALSFANKGDLMINEQDYKKLKDGMKNGVR